MLGTGPRRYPRLVQSISIVIYLIILFSTYRLSDAESGITVGSGVLILITALMPSLLWIHGIVSGLPVFPLFTLTFVWTFALPLLNESPRVMTFGVREHLVVGLMIAGFLMLATLAWVMTGHRPSAPRGRFRVLDSRRGVHALIIALGCNVLFNASRQGGFLVLAPGFESIVRGVLLGLGAVAAFVLPYLVGERRLSRYARWSVWLLLALDALVDLSSLLMIGALSTAALALLGYTLGRRRLPTMALALLLALAALLQAGKARIRERYRQTQYITGAAVGITHYPSYVTEWIQEGTQSLFASDPTLPTAPASESFGERSSLVHLLLRVRVYEMTGTPSLKGATYAIIPFLLVPRILSPDKPRSHEGSYLLSMHYGLQSRVDTYSTTIAWGLANEAYANFALPGLLGLALLMGSGMGALARWTRDAPMLSMRSLFGILCLGYALQVEFTAAVLVTALFQSAGGLLAFGLVFARPATVGHEPPVQARR